MAHSNHTANYELSQFVANDKPTFLGDYNGDMSKIDAAIKAADNKAGAADTTAESAAALATSASTTATEAATDAATAIANATTALNTANNATTTAQNASTAAQSASTTASAAATKADAAKAEAEAATAAVALKPSYDETFARMFSMTSNDVVPTGTDTFTVREAGTIFKVAKNTDETLAKFYGRVQVTCSALASADSYKLCTLATGFSAPTAAFNIFGLTGEDNNGTPLTAFLKVTTTGDVELWANLAAGTTSVVIMLPPCIYVMQDFGD